MANLGRIFAALLALVAMSADALDDQRSYDQSEKSIKEGFSQLSILKSGLAVVAYNPSVTKIINKKRGDLPPTHDLFYNEGVEANDDVLIETSLSGADGERFYLIFFEGPSLDPSFYLVSADAKTDKPFAEIWSEAVAIPSTGYIYAAGRTNRMFTERTKYLVKPSGLVEAKQPYSYVGLKTKTLKPITIYSSPNKESVVAQLPEGADVEVLLTNGEKSKDYETCFLVKTPFGLLGWVWVYQSQYDSKVIEGLSWWGD